MKSLALVLTLLCTGCGTVRNLQRGNRYDPEKTAMYPYGGVGIDQQEIGSGLRVLRRIPPQPAAIPAAGKVVAHAADLPFTLVGDTVTYPYCVLSGIGHHYSREFYEQEQYRLDPNYEGEFERFRREYAKRRVPELEVSNPP